MTHLICTHLAQIHLLASLNQKHKERELGAMLLGLVETTHYKTPYLLRWLLKAAINQSWSTFSWKAYKVHIRSECLWGERKKNLFTDSHQVLVEYLPPG